jgi:hypothetical protein
MPQVVDLDLFTLHARQMREEWLEPEVDHRADGRIHVSSIIHKILVEQDPKRYGQELKGQARWNLVLGLGWEEVAFTQIRRMDPTLRFARQVSLERDKVLGTVDAIDNHDRIWETKFTRYAVRRPANDAEYNHYWWQIMAYCHMHRCSRGCLLLCHWGYDGPAVRLIEVEFTAQQLHSNWQMLMHHAKSLGKEV